MQAPNLSTECLPKTMMRHITTMKRLPGTDWLLLLLLLARGPLQETLPKAICRKLPCAAKRCAWQFLILLRYSWIQGIYSAWIFWISDSFYKWCCHYPFSTLNSQIPKALTQPERWDSEFHRSYSTPPTSQGHWNDHLGGWKVERCWSQQTLPHLCNS